MERVGLLSCIEFVNIIFKLAAECFGDGFMKEAERCIVKLFRIVCFLNQFKKCAMCIQRIKESF